MPGLRRTVAERLERGAWRSPPVAALSALWAAIADPVRPLALPSGARVIGVGGATLGGAGKTPVAVELARRIAGQGRRVAVVGRAYRAAPRVAGRAGPASPVGAVGDEALVMARALAADGVAVFVGRDRETALAEAARSADVIVVDALLQARPTRLARSLLVVDGHAPFGAARCPPSGDLRATRERLLDAADAVIAVCRPGVDGVPVTTDKPVLRAESRIAGARAADGARVGLETLRALRVGVVLALARPERVLAALADAGVHPAEVQLFGDHDRPRRPAARGARVDVWLTTAKCATKPGWEADFSPRLVLEQRLMLPAEIDALTGGQHASDPW